MLFTYTINEISPFFSEFTLLTYHATSAAS